MGLFSQKKKQQSQASDDASLADQQHFFDEYFREELRNHGRWYFEKVITENAALFKQDLDATLTHVNAVLRQHIAKQLGTVVAHVNTVLKEHILKEINQQMQQYGAAMQQAQEQALSSLSRSAQALEEQHKQLSTTLQQNLVRQEQLLVQAFEQNMAQVIEYHLAGVLRDQYDLKTQLPAIMQQLEANKDAIKEDMQL